MVVAKSSSNASFMEYMQGKINISAADRRTTTAGLFRRADKPSKSPIHRMLCGEP